MGKSEKRVLKRASRRRNLAIGAELFLAIGAVVAVIWYVNLIRDPSEPGLHKLVASFIMIAAAGYIIGALRSLSKSIKKDQKVIDGLTPAEPSE